MSDSDWREREHLCLLACLRQIAPAERLADVIELVSVVETQVGRPSVIRVNQVHLDFRDVLSFVDELGLMPGIHGFRFR